jgi:hypothetical protein
MNKTLLTMIIFSVGVLSGYCFIVFAGYTSSWTIDLSVIFADVLKKYDLLCLLKIVMAIKELIIVTLTAIPIFSISSLFLVYFIKTDLKLIKWASSLGVVIIPAFTSGFPSILEGWFFIALVIVIVPLLVNLFFIDKISSIINASNKNNG